MNKIIKVMIFILICVLTAGCGKSGMVKTTEDAIAKIGEVTIDSKDVIAVAEGYYNALSDKQKEQVSNTSVLVDARTTYNRLVEEASADKEVADEEEIADEEMTECEEIVTLYVLYYAKGLKSPRSLQVNDAWVRLSGSMADVVVSLSAENSYGGRVEKVVGTSTGFWRLDGEEWTDALARSYAQDQRLGVPNYWTSVSISDNRTVSKGERMDPKRIQGFYDENVYTVE